MNSIKNTLKELAARYNNPEYFGRDPVIFPRHFNNLYLKGMATLQDVEISALLCSHLAWGRREMIVKSCNRLMDEMNWQPYKYVMQGIYRCDNTSLHRTVKWCEIANIMENLKEFYKSHTSLEALSAEDIRVTIFGRKPDANAANKKIHMMRRWLVRDDGKVDLGVWKNISPSSLIIPLDVHVHRTALKMGITKRRSSDYKTALEITSYLKGVFPDDPCLGDFALFAQPASGYKE